MNTIDSSITKNLYHPSPTTHKGQNGRVLIIAGSEKYHGAMLLAVQTASRIVDMVYVYTTANNLRLVDMLKSDTSVFITVGKDELKETMDLVDAVLIGPGVEESRANKKLVDNLVKKYPEKKIIIDATSVWQVEPLLLHPNCLVTPHSREFEHLFNVDPNPGNVLKMAKYYQCVIILKGHYDYVSDGKEIWENRTGNAGMTKGGTGDVLAGMAVGLSAKNSLLLSAQAAVYLSGLAGDNLYKKYSTFFNAEDVMREVGEVWKKEIGN